MQSNSPKSARTPLPKLDAGVAHSARVWNYLLGGKDNFAADRKCEFGLGEYIPTAKNGQVSGIFEKYGFEKYGEQTFRCRIENHHVAAPAWMKIN